MRGVRVCGESDSAAMGIHRVLNSDNTMDITEKLQAEIANDRLEVKISNELAGRDPARQTVKEAKIDYRLDGNDRSVTVKENSVLVLPQDSFASYPPPGGTLHCDNGKTVFTAFAVRGRKRRAARTNRRAGKPFRGD